MTNDKSVSEKAQARSVETVRDHLLRFLRLLAKDIVSRLADTDAGGSTRVNKSKVSRQNP
jgi:hypothetical protein